MDFVAKLKETLISVLPIMAIVLILNFTIAPLGTANLLRFLLGGLLLIVGLSLFLAGTEIGMVPVGEKLGSVLTQKRNIWFMILIGFVIGFAVTLAEPDVSVLAGQVHDLNPGIPEGLLTVMIALGVGLFVDIGLIRTVLGLKLKWVLIVFYGLVFLMVILRQGHFGGRKGLEAGEDITFELEFRGIIQQMFGHIFVNFSLVGEFRFV